ncbi:TonB-dependent receptor plug domain-containing protein [Asticcacaulis sp. 201]|uniref:TonB-dependent receptor plug domain-containing protein n=1 Tax=Asticcacaulis sp. 201 TaxID=3028787 RepID=UPI0029162E8D|nr:TonB-dependent receptor plug domain-containing protein [Asticcacaulis sp. 201]MDV6331110.1 TonB-dependent receptor plug domain-containing protein [Asticcacaulis sp. 201]
MTIVTVFAGMTLTHAAFAQDAAPAADTSGATEVVVVGTRVSQRSSIDRKKKAKTATDSIVAEDVGKFPDRNIGEAISRIAGVALSRSDYGEGETVALRGSTSDQVNVEIDGLGVQNTSTTGGLQFGGNGRSKDFREFPADLIKSVDVVKGSTAAQTEGGIGGAILVTSRTALDFKKPFFSVRFDETMNSLGKKWTPGYNVIATRKFLNDRLGILANISQSTVENDNNAIQQSNGNLGMMRNAYSVGGSGSVIGTGAIDLDGSPNKTFTFNPSTLSGAGINTAFANSSETPMSLLTKSAAAKTKADCYAAFPLLTGQSAATAQRTNELITCLNQWGDYTPSLIRYFVRENREIRQTIDLRADYRVNDDLDVFVRGTWNRRKNHDMQLTYNVGGFNFNPTTSTIPANGSNPAYSGPAYADVGGVRTAIPNSGYYVYDGLSYGNGQPNTPAGSNLNGNTGTANGVRGAVANILPGSMTFDENHHLLSATITDGSISTDQIQNVNDIRSTYLSTGFDYHHGPISAKFILGRATSEYSRYDYRINPGLTYAYGQADISVSSGGLWSVAYPSTLRNDDPSLYVITRPAAAARGACTPSGTNPCVPGQTAAYTIAQQPWTSFNIGYQYGPRLSETEENTARFDLTYNFDGKVPFIKNLATGFNIREVTNAGWDGSGRTVKAENTHNGTTPFSCAGLTGAALALAGCSSQTGTPNPGYEPPVIVARQSLRPVVRACDDTKYGATGTAAPTGALPCNYGYQAITDKNQAFEGTFTLRPADLQNILAQSFLPAKNQFFAGYPDRGNLIDGWSQINVEKFYQLIDEISKTPAYSAGGSPIAHHNFDCIKVCTGSDGKEYDMLFRKSVEKVTAAYWMVDFEQELPWNMLFNGNIGTRMVKTDVEGSGYITLSARRCNSLADCTGTTNVSATTLFNAQKTITVSNHTTDWMPSYNYNLWVLRDKLVARYYAGRVIARAPINNILPGGTCTFDQRFDSAGGADPSCTTFGNPALKPFVSNNHNWSLEWYPNRDTQFSFAVFKNDVKSGNITTGPVNDQKLLEGTGAVDPVTGADVTGLNYDYTQYINGNGFIRRGKEYAFKTAFTFLPWYFKYLGADGNYATINSSTTVGGIRDPNSGDVLPPIGEPSYYANLSFWYDDGRTNARLAWQGRSDSFTCISGCGVNIAANYPGDGYTQVRLPYNPGFPVYAAESQYLDFKVSHKLNETAEVFLQATNIRKEKAKLTTQGSYNTFSDGTESILEVGYAGYRVTTGFTLRY